jgi:hypothetical protein
MGYASDRWVSGATPSHETLNTTTAVEVCPDCGDFVDYDEINPVTGFCFTCSPSDEQLRALSKVKLETSLAANADAIEYYMVYGRMNGKVVAGNVWKALKLAQSDRPVCIVCGERITRSPRNSIFCRRNKECRRYSRRYVYLYRERGMTKVQALAQIFIDLTGE